MREVILHAAQACLAALDRAFTSPLQEPPDEGRLSMSPSPDKQSLPSLAGNKRTRSEASMESGEDNEAPAPKRACAQPSFSVLDYHSWEVRREREQQGRWRTLSVPRERVGLLGPLPRAQFGGLKFRGRSVQACVRRNQGVHPQVHGAFLWRVRTSFEPLFSGWYTCEEVVKVAAEYVQLCG